MVGEIGLLPERISNKIVIDGNGCWLWTGFVLADGYGRTWLNGRNEQAHRAVFMILRGQIANILDHYRLNPDVSLPCSRRCVNPDHVDQTTQRINTLRGRSRPAENARLVSCRRGHSFSNSNTYNYRGMRHCKECQRRRVRDYRARMEAK